MPKKKPIKPIRVLPDDTPLKIDKTFEEAIKATMIAADKKAKIQKQKDH